MDYGDLNPCTLVCGFRVFFHLVSVHNLNHNMSTIGIAKYDVRRFPGHNQAFGIRFASGFPTFS